MPAATRRKDRWWLSQAQPVSLYKKNIMCSEPAAPEMPSPFWYHENQISRTEILRRASKSTSYHEKSKSCDVGKQQELSNSFPDGDFWTFVTYSGKIVQIEGAGRVEWRE
jgi:hypothetical protein